MKTFLKIISIALPVLFGGLTLGLWAGVFGGGKGGVIAWYFLQLLSIFAALFLVGLMIYWIVTRRLSGPTVVFGLVLLFATWPLAWMFGVLQVAYPSNLNRVTERVEVRLPLNVPARVAWGGDGLAVNYHAGAPQQRWAYDLVVDPAFHGSANLEDYGCYGQEVVAPIDGKVVMTHDGQPDHTPGQLSNDVAAPEGNFVALQIPQGSYLLLAHMQPGSVRVEAGDTVKEGDVLGLCGNSGNTSEPHIHMHLQQDDPGTSLAQNGITEGLPLFFRDVDGPAMPSGGFEVVDNVARPKGPVLTPLTVE